MKSIIIIIITLVLMHTNALFVRIRVFDETKSYICVHSAYKIAIDSTAAVTTHPTRDSLVKSGNYYYYYLNTDIIGSRSRR